MDEEEANKAARFEQQIVIFFGTKERAEAFWRLEQPEQRLEAVWALPVMQDLIRKNNLSVHEKSLGMFIETIFSKGECHERTVDPKMENTVFYHLIWWRRAVLLHHLQHS
jgi:hypothetical protein